MSDIWWLEETFCLFRLFCLLYVCLLCLFDLLFLFSAILPLDRRQSALFLHHHLHTSSPSDHG